MLRESDLDNRVAQYTQAAQLVHPRTLSTVASPTGTLLDDGVMMLRVLLLTLTLFSGLAQAGVVLQRPIELDTGNGQLFGSLLLPKSDQPVPVVLIVAGSGPTDLAATPDERNLSVDAYVADTVAWGEKLKTDPRLGPLILLGHSEGALIATLAAPKLQAAGVISLSGSGRPVDQVLRQQLGKRLPPALMLRSNELLDSLKAGRQDNAIPPPLEPIFRPSVQPYLISLFRQDPAAAFSRLRMPALIVQGRNDIQVSVDDAKALKAAKPDAQLVIIDGMNHILRIVPDDIPQQLASYNNPQLPLAAALEQPITRFIDGLARH